MSRAVKREHRVVTTLGGDFVSIEWKCPCCEGRGWHRNPLVGCALCSGHAWISGGKYAIWRGTPPEVQESLKAKDAAVR